MNKSMSKQNTSSRKEITHTRIVETAARAIRRSGYDGTGVGFGFGDDGTNCKPGPMAKVFSGQQIARSRVKIDKANIGSSETPGYADATRKFYRWQQHQWTKASFSDRVKASLNRLSQRSG